MQLATVGFPGRISQLLPVGSKLRLRLRKFTILDTPCLVCSLFPVGSNPTKRLTHHKGISVFIVALLLEN